MKVAVIGAGMSGLVATVVIKRAGGDVTLFEREARAGKKLLATGNGRCNLTNTDINLSRYHGDTDFAEFALNEYNQYFLIDFMESIGIRCIQEGEKIFPSSLQASSVLDMLRKAEGESEICNLEVKQIVPYKKGFGIKTENGEQTFDKVIVCCGGKAAPKLSGGGAYKLLSDIGHTVTDLLPAIVQLRCKNTKALDGVKVNANVKIDGKQESGEVLFTSYGLSGPPILQLSRDAVGKKAEIDLMPELSFKDVFDILINKRKLRYLTAEDLFNGILNKKLGREILRMCNILPFSKPISDITDREIKSLASVVKSLVFDIEGHNGFENAQVTAGGICCKEFCDKTMESKKFKGLYAAGEMLNVDGDCGGFNLQWAFSSGYLAAVSALSEDL